MDYQNKSKEELIIELQKLEEIQIKESDISLDEVLKIANLGTWKYDSAKDLFTFNDQFYAIFRTTAEKEGGYIMSSGQYAQKFVYKDDMDQVGIEIQKALETPDNNYTSRVDHRIICTDGSLRFVSVSILVKKNSEGKTISTYGVLQDITERKQMEETLRKSEMLYSTIFDNSPIAVQFYRADGLLVKVNTVCLEIFGVIDTDDIKDWNIFNDPNVTAEQKQKLLNGETIAFKVNFDFNLVRDLNLYRTTKSGIRIFDVIISNLGIGFIAQIQDITESKKAEQELIIAKERAQESDRLKTTFLQNISHEIRTPLNAISGFAGMLNKAELSEEKRNSFVSIIQNNSKQLISIVSDILTISALEAKQEKANLSKVCINNIILDLIATFKPQAVNKNISLYAKQGLNDRQSEIYTDKTKVAHILTNLISNALKFIHEGFIEFGYEIVEIEGLSSLQFYVKDTGIGIKPELQRKIFERFGKVENSLNKLYSGTGLGLSISKAFVDLLGGKIWVQSEIAKGSTFYFTIPYMPVNDIDINTMPTEPNQNLKTVLIAEDEEYNYLLIEELLIDFNFKIIHAKDGKEAIDIFISNPKIDLILMDIKMPIMDGYQAAKAIKIIDPTMTIIAQSAYALDHERAQFEGIFDDYLTKPINEEDLIQKVRQYIDK